MAFPLSPQDIQAQFVGPVRPNEQPPEPREFFGPVKPLKIDSIQAGFGVKPTPKTEPAGVFGPPKPTELRQEDIKAVLSGQKEFGEIDFAAAQRESFIRQAPTSTDEQTEERRQQVIIDRVETMSLPELEAFQKIIVGKHIREAGAFVKNLRKSPILQRLPIVRELVGSIGGIIGTPLELAGTAIELSEKQQRPVIAAAAGVGAVLSVIPVTRAAFAIFNAATNNPFAETILDKTFGAKTRLIQELPISQNKKDVLDVASTLALMYSLHMGLRKGAKVLEDVKFRDVEITPEGLSRAAQEQATGRPGSRGATEFERKLATELFKNQEKGAEFIKGINERIAQGKPTTLKIQRDFVGWLKETITKFTPKKDLNEISRKFVETKTTETTLPKLFETSKDLVGFNKLPATKPSPIANLVGDEGLSPNFSLPAKEVSKFKTADDFIDSQPVSRVQRERFEPLEVRLPQKKGVEQITQRIKLHNNIIDGQAKRGIGDKEAKIQPDEVVDIENFISQVGDKLFDDVRLSLRNFAIGGAGQFDFSNAIITLAKESIREGVSPSRTAIHELWHSLSRFLPEDKISLFQEEFSRNRTIFAADNPWFNFILKNGGRDSKGNFTLTPRGVEKFNKKFKGKAEFKSSKEKDIKVLKFTNQTYRFKNIDEFFSEELTDRSFVHDFQPRAKSFIGKIKDLFFRVVDGVKKFFGKPSSRKIVERTYDDFLSRRFPQRQRDINLQGSSRDRVGLANLFDKAKASDKVSAKIAEIKSQLSPEDLVAFNKIPVQDIVKIVKEELKPKEFSDVGVRTKDEIEILDTRKILQSPEGKAWIKHAKENFQDRDIWGTLIERHRSITAERVAEFMDGGIGGRMWKEMIDPVYESASNVKIEGSKLSSQIKNWGIIEGTKLAKEASLHAQGKIESTNPKVIRAAKEAKAIYDNLIDRININRRDRGLEPIEKRKNYVTHIGKLNSLTEVYGSLDRVSINKKINEVKLALLDKNPKMTEPRAFEIARKQVDGASGIEKFVSAKDVMFKFLKRRLSDYEKNPDLIMSLGAYIPGALRYIHQSKNVAKNKAFLSVLPTNIRIFIDNWNTEQVAGRTPPSIIGVAVRGPLKLLRGTLGANIILGNAATVTMQLTSWAQVVAFAGIRNTTAGITTRLSYYLSSLGHKVPGVDRFADNLDFGKYKSSRTKVLRDLDIDIQMGDSLVDSAFRGIGKLETLKNPAAYSRAAIQLGRDMLMGMMKMADQFTVGATYEAFYIKGIKDGLTPNIAANYAEVMTGKTQANYFKEGLPPILNTTEGKTLLQFGTYSLNQFEMFTGDFGKKFKFGEKSERTKKEFFKQFILYLFAGYMIDTVSEKIFGRQPYGIKDLIDEFYDYLQGNSTKTRVIQQAKDTALGYVPYLSSAKYNSLNPVSEFGKDVINTFLKQGPAQSRSQKQMEEKWALLLLLPYGGNQIKKSLQGLQAGTQLELPWVRDVTKGGTKPKYEINGIVEQAKAIIYGPSATEAAIKFHDKPASKELFNRIRSTIGREERNRVLGVYQGRGWLSESLIKKFLRLKEAEDIGSQEWEIDLLDTRLINDKIDIIQKQWRSLEFEDRSASLDRLRQANLISSDSRYDVLDDFVFDPFQ